MLPQAERQKTPTHLSWNFAWATLTGVLFQAGAAFVNTGTVVATFVNGLTTSVLAVGVAEFIARFGWLLPQLFAAHYAQARPYRKPIYLLGGWGRAFFLGLLAILLLARPPMSMGATLVLFFVLWTLYAFISGLAGVPYNDIIGRTIPSPRRSRLLAWRFFGGGLLAVGAGLVVREILRRPGQWPFPANYGLIFALGASILALSTFGFARVREPPAPRAAGQPGFGEFLRAGLAIARADHRFRLFLMVQWLAGVTSMAFPFYILQARQSGLQDEMVGTLLTVQMVGGLALNPLWGWWGDRRGKLSLLKLLALVSGISPSLAVLWAGRGTPLGYSLVFFFLGAVSSGSIIADLGYLMEISPDDRRPAYSGYMNALVAPTRFFPVIAAALAELVSFQLLFALAALATLVRWGVLTRLEEDFT